MGAEVSSELGDSTEGYHVLRVHDNSPGYRAGLEAYFDFIVAIGNTRLDKDNDMLRELLKVNADRDVTLSVYNSKSQSVRQVSLVPTSTWGGPGLIGISIRFCSFDKATNSVWHILEVERGSPAEQAGLSAHTDYVIGSETVLHTVDDFYNLIERHHQRPLKLYVYNVALDACREVLVTPNADWGGQGSLGCGIGFGFLHQIPNVVRDTPAAHPAHTIQLGGSPQAPPPPQAPPLPPPAPLPTAVAAPPAAAVQLPTAMAGLALSGQATPADVTSSEGVLQPQGASFAPATAGVAPLTVPYTLASFPPPAPLPATVTTTAGAPPTAAAAAAAATAAAAAAAGGGGGVQPIPTFDPSTFTCTAMSMPFIAPSGLLSGPSIASAASVLPPPAPLPSIPGMPVSTPINLPGLPPITVSATLPISIGDPAGPGHGTMAAGVQ